MDKRVKLAKDSVENFVRTGSVLSGKYQDDPELLQPGAVFVTLKIEGELRGCIGTLMPVRANLGEEIIYNAISACRYDPRFEPVKVEELAHLHYEVSVLSEPVKVGNYQELDPKRYGVIVSKGNRRGVLLPDLEGIDTVEKQVAIACRKGGISPQEGPELYRFTTVLYGEDE
ncbi:AmmeMemoRadiSam system protein A [bacterium]|nr:AmmeMemoRadiSam system protein A [bacterium]